MIDLLDKGYCPTLEEIGDFVRNEAFRQFCREVKERYRCSEKIEFSACSWEKGWNIKFKKAGKNLCTVYPRESFFTVLVVIGRKEKDRAESLLPSCTRELREIYRSTKEGCGQKWLMLDLEDRDGLYDDVLRLMDIRRGERRI